MRRIVIGLAAGILLHMAIMAANIIANPQFPEAATISVEDAERAARDWQLLHDLRRNGQNPVDNINGHSETGIAPR